MRAKPVDNRNARRWALACAALVLIQAGVVAGEQAIAGPPLEVPAAGRSLPSHQDRLVVAAAVRSPSFSVDGRLAFEVNGDLWVSGLQDGSPDLSIEALVRVTADPAWDRDPAWTSDGGALVFTSDRSGNTDLWRVEVEASGQPRSLTQLTETPEPETEPTIAADGTIAFVRGRGATADIWMLTPEGEEQRLTHRPAIEASPSLSPDGGELAYVSGRQLRRLVLRPSDADPMAAEVEAVRESAGVETRREDVVVVGDMSVVTAAWSPRGDLIAFAARGTSGGVFVTPHDGRYTNMVSPDPAEIAWSADGDYLALAELVAADLGYNGDPDRLGDRRVGDIGSAPRGAERLWILPAPASIEMNPESLALLVAVDRESHNAEAFDRVWERLRDLYYGERPRREAWLAIRSLLRPRALAAGSEQELAEVVHELIRQRPTVHAEVTGRAGVSSAHPLATAAGIEMLEKGGNVIDAAVAVSFALSVVEPDASGIGGYGEMVLYLSGMNRPVAIEFLSRAPAEASLDNAAYVGSRLPSDGPVLANVPGTVRGMDLAWKKYGSGNLEWSELLQPAIRYAEEGFELDDAFTTTLARERDSFENYESSVALFFAEGEPLRAGDTLKNPDLAWTLRQIAEGGADAFYEGEVARRIVQDLRGKGNAMTLADLRRYFAIEREPIVGEYRGHTVYSAVPAAGGGVSLVAKLQLLDNADPFGLYTEDPAALHALIEAWKLQPSTRGRIADPSLWPVDLEPVLDPAAAARRWQACFDPTRATGPVELELDRDRVPACERVQQEIASLWGEEAFACEDDELGCRNDGTTAFTVADSEGNFVAVTQTLGTWGGNFYVTPGLGFLYNDKLRSYGSDPSRYGARLPYARHGTSIAPTLVFNGTGDGQRPVLAVGAAGNAWITSAVYQVVTGVIDGGLGPQRALELPRFLVGVRRQPDDPEAVREIIVQIEDAVAPSVLEALRRLGHGFQKISLRGEMRMGYGAAVLIEDGTVRAGADPRRSGAAAAIQ